MTDLARRIYTTARKISIREHALPYADAELYLRRAARLFHHPDGPVDAFVSGHFNDYLRWLDYSN